MNRTLTVAAPVGALVAGLVLVPAAPSSAWGLNDVATLAPGGASVVVASDPGGNAAAAWVAGGQVQVARRPVGSSTWTPAVTVSPAGVSATDPDVSVGPTGVAAVVWVAAGDVQVAVQPTGQPWGAARNASDNPTWSDTDPQVEVGPAGIATVVWAGQNAASTIVRSKTASAASISAQDALTPQVTGTFSGLSLARNAAGDAVAAWRWDGAGGSYVQAARRLNGAAWSAPQAQGTVPSVADAPSVTLDGSGNAALGWGSGPTADTNLPYVATWPRGGNLGGPVGLSAAPARRVALAESADGRLAAAWSSPSGLMYADVGAPAFALSTGPVGSHAVAFSDTGAATVVWTAAGGGVAVAHRPSGGLWTSVPVPSVAGSVPVVAAHGIDATVVWADGAGGPVRARTLDDAAPTAVHLTAPMRVLNAGTLIKAGWIGADTWSPVRYEVQRQVATYRTVLGAAGTWLTTTATDAAYKAGAGQTVCLRVRGSDQAGNVGAWSVPRCATTPVNDKTLKPKRLSGREVWKSKGGRGYFSKDYALSSTKGARLVLPEVRAKRVALLVGTGRGYGTVSVRLGKDALGSYSFASRDKRTQVVVPVALFSGVRTGRLTITVTSQGRPVRIDGVYAGPA